MAEIARQVCVRNWRLPTFLKHTHAASSTGIPTNLPITHVRILTNSATLLAPTEEMRCVDTHQTYGDFARNGSARD